MAGFALAAAADCHENISGAGTGPRSRARARAGGDVGRGMVLPGVLPGRLRRLCFFFFFAIGVGCVVGLSPHDGFRGEEREPPVWHRLVREDFHSELEQHEFALCIVTVPWCGESRKLMKDILRLVGEDLRSFSGLRLFAVYQNRARPSGRRVPEGGSGSPGFTLFRYGTPYKYNGRRNASSIMAAVRQGMDVLLSDTVLLRIQSTADLEAFPDTADKAVILCDFCGWERKLRRQEKQEQRRATSASASASTSASAPANDADDESPDESPTSVGKGDSDERSDEEHWGAQPREILQTEGRGEDPSKRAIQFGGRSGGAPLLSGKSESRKLGQSMDLERTVGDTEDQMLDCMGQNTLGCDSGREVRWADESETPSDGRLYVAVAAEEMNLGRGTETSEDEPFCSEEEYESFKAVYYNVSRLAADWMLTPQKIRFAIVQSERVASQAGISTQGRPWLLLYVLHDFERLPHVFDGAGDVEEFIFDHSAPLVVELEGHFVLPTDLPSVILFIDRMSNSTEIQEQSKKALDVLDALSYHYASVADRREENLTTKGDHWDENEDRISEREKVRTREPTVAQMVESGYGRLLTLLRNVDPAVGNLPHGVFFELPSEPKKSDGGRNPLLGGPEARRLTQLKGLEEKVKQSLFGQTDSTPTATHKDYRWSQKQESGLLPQFPGRLHDEDSSHGSAFPAKPSTEVHEPERAIGGSASDSSSQSDEEGEKKTSDGTNFTEAAESVPSQNRAPTTVNSEPYNAMEIKSKSEVSVGEDLLEQVMGMPNLDQADCREARPSGGFHPLSIADRKCPLIAATTKHERRYETVDRETHEEAMGEEILQDEGVVVDNYWDGVGFFFVDGEDRLKEKLTRSTSTLALVIISPQEQAHYVAPPNVILSISALFSFLDSFFSGLLTKTFLSGPPLSPPRQPPRPPFVNQDFHELNSVPRVSVDSFSKLVTGFLEGDDSHVILHRDGLEGTAEQRGNVSESAWDKDVVVLFTTPWCGFCKRIELVFREIHRALQLVRGVDVHCTGVLMNCNEPTSTQATGCAGAVPSMTHSWCVARAAAALLGSLSLLYCLGLFLAKRVQLRDELAYQFEPAFAGDKPGKRHAWERVDAVFSEPPLLMQMDCSLNDCSQYLKDISEEETYPAIVLFPARNKLSPAVYDGAPTVQGIYNYLTWHRTAADSAVKREGNTCIASRDGFRVSSSTAMKIASSQGRKSKPEALTFVWQLDPRQMNVGKHVNVGSFLLATEKLLGASMPFEHAIVLIVGTSGDMVHGLIVNKPMSWANVQGLDGKAQQLLNTAALGYGGPVVENRKPLLILTRLRNLEGFSEVIPGLYYGSIASESNPLQMVDTGSLSAKDFWFFLGYSSWASHQLQIELAQDFWQVTLFSNELIKWPSQWSN